MRKAFLTAWGLLLGGVSAATDITFFAVSDTHYGQSSASKDANRKAIVGYLNALPGVNYPASVGGGPVGTPRGVVIPGDLIERPDAALWKDYVADYGVNGEGRIKFKVFDGLGNHDVWNYSTSAASSMIKSEIIARNGKRSGISGFDAQNLHYSWDWDQVHFVQLNLFIGTQPGASAQWDPYKSLDFLKADLEKNVGSSGRPVLVMQHFNVDTLEDYYQNTQKQAMAAMLKKYNCIGLLHGHSHAKKIYRYQGIDIFDDGTAMNADIMVFRIMDGRMYVVNRVGGAWGSLKLDKAITMGTPVAANTGAPARRDFGIPGLGRIGPLSPGVKKLEIVSPAGRVVRRLSVDASLITWDRRDEGGRPVTPGVYLIRMLGDSSPAEIKVALAWSLSGNDPPSPPGKDL